MKKLGKKNYLGDMSIEAYACKCRSCTNCNPSCTCANPGLLEPRQTTTATQSELSRASLENPQLSAYNYQK